MSKLEQHLFNDEVIPQIISRVNEFQKEKYGSNVSEIARITKLIAGIDGKIDNITNAVMNGFANNTLKEKMEELEQEKIILQNTISELNVVSNEFTLTEEMLSKVIKKFKDFVITKNIPECKKFIEHYVDRINIHQETVEVILKVTSTSFVSEPTHIPIYTAIIPIKKLWKLFPVRK